jgi:putative hemolysin
MEAFWYEFVGVLALIGVIGFFSACEVSVLAGRRSRLQELADAGYSAARIVLGYQREPEKFLATVHVGSIFSLVLLSGLAGLFGVGYSEPFFHASSVAWVREMSGWLSMAVVVLSVGFLVVVFGELIPKSLALRNAIAVAIAVAPIMRVLSVLFRVPSIAILSASNTVLRLFNDKTSFSESRLSEEEFKLMLAEGARQGVIDKTEHDLISSIFEFTDTTAKEVMIPRPDVVALDIEIPRERLIKIVLEEGFSRMPVYRGTIDNIIGVVYSKDLLGLMEHRNLIILEDVIRPAYFVPETKQISQIMRELQAKRLHMAVVIDEFGGTEGVITMEDILEEIVGEIHDEYDEVLKDIEQSSDGSFLVNGRVAVAEFNERFHAGIPQNAAYETVSGFLAKHLGRIPELNEEITFEGISFAIVKKSLRRIRQVRVRRNASPLPGPH